MTIEEKLQSFHNVFNQLNKTRQTEYLDNFSIRYTHDSTAIGRCDLRITQISNLS